MSTSSLWTINRNFIGENEVEFSNSWLFSPIVWDVLFEKYMPEKAYSLFGTKTNYITATMFDREIERELIKRIDGIEDSIMWCLTDQNIFSIKDRKLVVDCVRNFLKSNSEFTNDLEEHIFKRFEDVADAIESLDENESPYFVFKNTSVDDNVEYWFEKYNEEDDEYEPASLLELNKTVTYLVVIENNDIKDFIPNQKLKNI